MDKKTLNILWTTDNVDTINNMIRMYAVNALRHNWYENVRVIIWGASAKIVKENEYVQDIVKQMIHVGIDVVACKACSDNLNASETLCELGVDVKYYGTGLTEIINDNSQALLTV